MSTSTFANGQSLSSTALTPDDVNLIFQSLVVQIFGIDPTADPNTAFTAVRVGWQKEGQPAWGIGEDVCIVMATADNAEYSQVRDNLYAPNDPQSMFDQMGFTQVWNVHLTLYGPNCFDRARLIVSAMGLDWAHDALLPNRLFALTNWPRPTYSPEKFQGRWWKRADLNLKFNELVNETMVVPTAASVDVTLLKDTGLSAEFTIPPAPPA